MDTLIYIPDLIEQVVTKVDSYFSTLSANPFHVYYDFGHHSEVLRQLQFKTENPDKPKKFPLIWFVTPFREKRNKYDALSRPLFHFVIAHDTENTYSMKERRDNVFLPVLYPVRDRFLQELYESRAFNIDKKEDYDYMDIQYAKVDSDGKNLFNDFVDVIDIQNFKVQVKNIC